ncbi:MAG TPA: prolyl oligopeptidase family serine peptidase [Amycolatopsis sp.]|nr:prolyl oligopeptidase family serine peptidase [Amycolatopsis sp.]
MITDAFADLDRYIGLPRVSGLCLAPDGARLAVAVATPDSGNSRYITALWEVDPRGVRPARQLTRSIEGDSDGAFTPSGDLLFVSKRPIPGQEPESAALWLLPAGGGDARVVAAPRGGVRGVVVSESGRVVFGTAMLPSSTGVASDTELRKLREGAGVSAILHEEFPVRYWDHDLGPDRTRLFSVDLTEASPEPRDLTGPVGGALDDECTWDITPDGSTVVATWAVCGSQRHTVVAIDVETGERRTLADDADHEYDSPRISPDGTLVAIRVSQRRTPEKPGDSWLAIVPITGGEIRDLTTAWDRWPRSTRWTPDGAALITDADDHGRAPLFHVDVETGEVTQLTLDDAAYTDFWLSPDGQWAYALRCAIDSPPQPVRIALDGSIETLLGPSEPIEVPGRLEEVVTTAEDGTPIRAWLALPHGADAPAPLVVQIHGGPLMSAAEWSWYRPIWPAVAAGYAVLFPDYALSTGYGLDFIRRGWGAFGDAPYTDVMRLTDAAQQRPDIDPDRAAVVGASFGGYLANWIAGHTDRFSAIVTHASIWNLPQLNRTTDIPHIWNLLMTPVSEEADSPHRFADAITTPMLITHGAADYRVPLTESLQLWWDLSSRSNGEASPHKFLHFPDEMHMVKAPGNVKVWTATILAFLDHHVLGKPWQPPSLLG